MTRFSDYDYDLTRMWENAVCLAVLVAGLLSGVVLYILFSGGID